MAGSPVRDQFEELFKSACVDASAAGPLADWCYENGQPEAGAMMRFGKHFCCYRIVRGMLQESPYTKFLRAVGSWLEALDLDPAGHILSLRAPLADLGEPVAKLYLWEFGPDCRAFLYRKGVTR
jgi:hypothetical protein